ncbi:MAG TPA: hypothetical protein VJ965_05845 [Anaerolineales bacterium]|nr:hypothetical protein [Anaerolineales bacterium]
MAEFVDLAQINLETNSPLWQVVNLDHEMTIQITNNQEEDHTHGIVALLPELKRNYRMQIEMKFLGHYLEDETAGWFGLAMRAQDVENYELVWFMPNVKHDTNVAYLPVAHGIVPWWTEAYARQEKEHIELPEKDWFLVQVDVIGDEFTLYVNGEKIMHKRFTYYLSEGKPGFYVGTATNAAFRLVKLEDF